MRGLLRALSFLTRGPFPAEDLRPKELARVILWFPVAGITIGGLVAAVYWVAAQGLPPFVAATLALLAGIAVTGGLHEDGLGDTFDALGGRSTPKEMLMITKDSRQGTFGVLAIVGSVMLRVAALAALPAAVGAWTLVVAHCVSRSAVVGVMATSKPVSSRGLGAAYAKELHHISALLTAALGSLLAVVVWGVGGFLIVGVVVVVLAIFMAWVHRNLGGYTGDVLGAVEQFAQAGVLVAAAWMFGRGWEIAPWLPWG